MNKSAHLLLIILLIFSGFTVMLIPIPLKTSAYTPHDTISINSDAIFAERAAAEEWPGDGSEGNPYIIQGLEINASSSNGIFIGGTTVDFIIKDSRVRDGGNRFTGIYLFNVENGWIDNCIIENNNRGIWISSAEDNKITYCSFINNNKFDLYHESSDKTTIANNTFIGNGIHITGYTVDHWKNLEIDSSNLYNGKPIYYWANMNGGTVPSGAGQVILANCKNISVVNQEITEAYTAIQVAYSSKCTISDNTVSHTKQYGIHIFHSNNNSVTNNHAVSNEVGILIEDSNNNNITDNFVNSNSEYGIYVSYSDNNSITGNNISENDDKDYWWSWGYGLCLTESYGNHIDRNFLFANGHSNIYLSSSNYNLIENNSLSFDRYASDEYGICLQLSDSRNNIVRDNRMSNSYSGIEESYTFTGNNSIIDNYITDCDYGIFLSWNSDGCSIINNRILHCGASILLGESRAVTVSNNTMIGGGIRFYGDLYNEWNTHEIDTLNTVNGKPVYYLKNLIGRTVPINVGQIILARCMNITIENHIISGVNTAISVGFSSNITIANVNISDCSRGIQLVFSDHNNIVNNEIFSLEGQGIYLENSDNNNISENIVSTGEEGISLDSTNNNIVSNNKITDCSAHGILLDSCARNMIRDNWVCQNTEGIYLMHSNFNDIEGNNASSNNRGISLEDSNDNTISHNFAYANNNSGIMLESSEENELVGNTISSNNNDGIYLHWAFNNLLSNNEVSRNNESGIHLQWSDNNNVTENSILFNAGSGIWVHDSSSSNMILDNRIHQNFEGIHLQDFIETIVSDNDISGNKIGIHLNLSSLATITYNKIVSNEQHGIYIEDSNDNVLHHNSIRNNFNQLHQTGENLNIWDNGDGEGNYWSDYKGVDEDDDGVGESKLPHQGVDWFPLTSRKKDILSDPLFLIFIMPLFVLVLLIIYSIVRRGKSKNGDQELKEEISAGEEQKKESEEQKHEPTISPPTPPKVKEG